MHYTKKLASVLLSTIFVCPHISALKTSVSLPENLCGLDEKYSMEIDSSPYNLNRLCDHIIANADDMPIDTLVRDTFSVCSETFGKIRVLLGNKSVPSDCFYIAGISNYVPIIEKTNHIMRDIILSKSDSIKHFFTPSEQTKLYVSDAFFTVSSAIKRYENIFHVELLMAQSRGNPTVQIYGLMDETWEGVWRISQLNSFLGD